MLIIHEALFFDMTMDHSLINPNQILHHGIQVCDNTFGATNTSGIYHADTFIPFVTQGAVVFFEPYLPFDEDFADCTCIELTSKSQRNTKNVSMTRNRPYGDGDSTHDRHAKEIERDNKKESKSALPK